MVLFKRNKKSCRCKLLFTLHVSFKPKWTVLISFRAVKAKNWLNRATQDNTASFLCVRSSRAIFGFRIPKINKKNEQFSTLKTQRKKIRVRIQYSFTSNQFVIQLLITVAMFLVIYMEGLVQNMELNNVYKYAHDDVCASLS